MMECICESCTRKDCNERTKQDDLRIVIQCNDFIKKNMTNSDRIRAMNDRELAQFLAAHDINQSCQRLYEKGYTPTATQLKEIETTLYHTYFRWLLMPAEEKE